jgi:hypothetical protein
VNLILCQEAPAAGVVEQLVWNKIHMIVWTALQTPEFCFLSLISFHPVKMCIFLKKFSECSFLFIDVPPRILPGKHELYLHWRPCSRHGPSSQLIRVLPMPTWRDMEPHKVEDQWVIHLLCWPRHISKIDGRSMHRSARSIDDYIFSFFVKGLYFCIFFTLVCNLCQQHCWMKANLAQDIDKMSWGGSWEFWKMAEVINRI